MRWFRRTPTKPEPTPAEVAAAAQAKAATRAVEAKAWREAEAKRRAAAFEAAQEAEWTAQIEAGIAEMARQRAIAERLGAYFPSDEGRGGLISGEIDLSDGPIALDGRSRRFRWRG